jgi:hypothetical protein
MAGSGWKKTLKREQIQAAPTNSTRRIATIQPICARRDVASVDQPTPMASVNTITYCQRSGTNFVTLPSLEKRSVSTISGRSSQP